MVNFTDMDSKESVGVEQVKEELAKARVELGRKRREVEEAEAKVGKLEEQLDVLVKLEEEVGEVGAVNRAAGGEPGASPTLWTPNPKEVEEGGAVTRSSWGAGLPPENFILPLFTDFLGKMLQKCQVLQIFGHKAKHPPLLLKIPNFEKSRYTD